MINKKEFGKRLTELRNECHLSQARLSQMLNVTYQAVSKWENGQSLPDIELIPRIAYVLGVSTDYLLFISNQPDPVYISNIVEAFEIKEGNRKILTVLHDTLPREDFYHAADMIEKNQLDYRLSIDLLAKIKDKTDIHSRKIPLESLTQVAIKSLNAVLTKMTMQVLNRKSNPVENIILFMQCPECEADLLLKSKREGTVEEWLECKNGHKLPIIEGVVDFGKREQKGNNWSNHFRSYEQFKKQMHNAGNIFTGIYSRYASAVESNIERILETKPRCIMEIGCGSGSYAGALIPRIDWPCILILTDISHRILRYVKRYFSETLYNPMVKIVYLCCDARNMPFKDETVDCITSFGGYENITEDAIRAFEESYRILKKAGHCIYTMSMVDDTSSKLVQNWINLMKKAKDPDLDLLQSRIKSKDDWLEINKSIGYSTCIVDKLVDEFSAPDTDTYPYDYDIDRWMGFGSIVSIK